MKIWPPTLSLPRPSLPILTATLLAGAFLFAVACDGENRFEILPPEAEASSASAALKAKVPAKAPTLLDVFFPDSKFGQCGAPVAVCAEATSNDNSPVRFEWSIASPSPLSERATADRSIEVTESKRDERRLTECIDFTPSTDKTMLDIRVERIDTIPGPTAGEGMSLYDSLSVPIYASGARCL